MEAQADSVLDGNLLSFISFRDSSARFSFAGQFTRTSDFSSLPTVRRRLKLYINFWRSLGTLQFILNVISLGYKIPFCYLPTPFFKSPRLEPHTHIGKKGSPMIDFLMVIMASGIARGLVRMTAMTTTQ